jgi:hypothetical protein
MVSIISKASGVRALRRCVLIRERPAGTSGKGASSYLNGHFKRGAAAAGAPVPPSLHKEIQTC